jgi:hypothetical protein
MGTQDRKRPFTDGDTFEAIHDVSGGSKYIDEEGYFAPPHSRNAPKL